ncbi:MAG: bacillithiol biosynthesis cysteine-adding enzyme BshC [Acidobacteria bacterium]|nr:bacillithiol biosynthesis cysteine-adding enzyme BshC [Acidobacteriota bacterium]
MKTQCLPFAQIPHTTRLFLDYLSYKPSVHEFYPRSPLFPEWVKEEAGRVRYDDARRQKVSDILERQNRNFGAGPKTLANIERLRRGAVAAVTGQQVGLFGGPLFSIFKALTAVKLAEQASMAGVECVPVFWLATEDHDLAEINHVALAAEGGLESLTVTSHGIEDAPVGGIRLGPEVEPVVERAVALLGDSEVGTWLREAYRPGETLGSAFGRLMAKLFADWGVILLDQYDPAFHELAKPILRQAIERSAELDEALLARGKAIEAAGYHQQVKVTSASTLLFEIQNGARTAVRRKGEGEFVVGEQRSSAQELLDRIEANPVNFSPNALLRPVVQDYLLPTLVYTGGPAEVAYFAQAAVVYEQLMGRVTPVLPRFSATLVEAKAQRVLEHFQLTLSDMFQGPEKLREMLATRALPSELQGQFADAKATLETSLAAIRESLARLDSTLVDAASNAEEKMQYQLSQLQARAARAEVLRNEVVTRKANFMSGALYPNKALQEREVAGVSFVARYGAGLLQSLYEAIHTDCHDHQMIEVS